jgi:hypothetical protein
MDNTDADNISAPYLDLHLEIDSEVRLRTKLYDKREDFNFPFVNLPFIGNNIAFELIRPENYSALCKSGLKQMRS